MIPVLRLSGTPGLFWVNSCPPLVVSPPDEPYRTLTAPAARALSNGAPTARSAKLSLLKSPAARAKPRSLVLEGNRNPCAPVSIRTVVVRIGGDKVPSMLRSDHDDRGPADRVEDR
jgi:hypothetical protein